MPQSELDRIKRNLENAEYHQDDVDPERDMRFLVAEVERLREENVFYSVFFDLMREYNAELYSQVEKGRKGVKRHERSAKRDQDKAICADEC
jgi:hypothetical protein